MRAEELVTAGRLDLAQALEMNAAVRAHLAQALEDIEGMTVHAHRLAQLRDEATLSERALGAQAQEVSANLARLAGTLEEIDNAVHRGAQTLREATQRTQTEPGARAEAVAAAQATLAGVETMSALAVQSREGIDQARRAVQAVAEQARPVPQPEDPRPGLRAASEEVASAQRQALQRSVATEATLQHSMTLAAVASSSSGSTDPARRVEHRTPANPRACGHGVLR